MSYKPPPDAASVFARYKELHEGERDLKPEMLTLADRELKAGASVGQLAKLTGLLPEVFRRRARTLGVERKRPPTVGKLKPGTDAPPPAEAPTRSTVQRPRPTVVSPPKTDPGRGPVMSDDRARVLAALAYERANDRQRAGLEQTGKEVSPSFRDFAVVAAAQAMGLLTTAELHHVDDAPAPPATEEH